MLLTPKKSIQNDIKERNSLNMCNKKVINEYKKNNNSMYYKNNNKKKYSSHKNTLLINKNKHNNSNVIFKRYELGNNIELPFKTIYNINYYDKSNMPYYTFNNYNRILSWSPIKNKSKDILLKTNYLLTQKNNNKKTSNSFKIFNANKRKNKKRNSEQRTIFSLNKNSIPNFNKNKNNGLNLYESIDINNYSNKNLNIPYKTQRNINTEKIELLSQLKNTSKKSKRLKLVKSAKYWPKKNKKNIKFENFKNQEYRDIKESKTYNKAKILIDNPNSFVYLMYNRIKNQKFDDDGNIKKLDLKKRFIEYKRDMFKLEQKARFELFNLKKQRVIGNEINKGRIISTNTFFNLAFARGDF